MIDVIGGPPATVRIPSALRAANSTASVRAAAATPIATHQIRMLTTRMVTRRVRSVSTPIGIVASPPTMLNTLASRPMVPFPMWNSLFSAGARTPSAERSAASRASTAASATNTRR